jgi:16S rRNA C967 or C1407 C5-methylase (RsmB/RsmF family)
MIAERMTNKGSIVCTDIDDDRLELVRENCERMGVTCVSTAVVEKGVYVCVFVMCMYV